MAPVERSISPAKITIASPKAISPMKRNCSGRANIPETPNSLKSGTAKQK